MIAKNDITGDAIRSKAQSSKFSEGYDRIFAPKGTPLGEDLRAKDRVKLGVSPSTIVVDIHSSDLAKD